MDEDEVKAQLSGLKLVESVIDQINNEVKKHDPKFTNKIWRTIIGTQLTYFLRQNYPKDIRFKVLEEMMQTAKLVLSINTEEKVDHEGLYTQASRTVETRIEK